MSGPPDLRAIFAEEAADLLDRLSAGALALESGGAGVVASMFRAAHTLKGSATLVGLPTVVALTHALEDLLSRVRSGELPADDELADVTLDTVDALRTMIPPLLAGEEDVVVPDPGLVPRLQSLATRDAAPPAPPGMVNVPSPAAEYGETDVHPRGSAPVPAAAPAPASAAGPAVPSVPALPATGVAGGTRSLDTMTIPRDRLDRLVRLAGESRTARLRVLGAIGPEHAADPDVEAAMADLDRTLESLQDQLLRARMVTLAAIAEPLRRAVRDVARGAGKEVAYSLEGERLELDRGVLDALRDPLLHLVRNAVDHGLETPSARIAAGKPATGTVTVRAQTAGRRLVVHVEDDGAGIDLAALRSGVGEPDLTDSDLLDRIFEPGVSTAATVTPVSGRGVGLDVVRTQVESVRGSVEVTSRPGGGTVFTLSVPVTLAVVRCLVVRSATERYAIPAHAVVSVAEALEEALVPLEGGAAIWVGGEIVPVTSLAAVVGADEAGHARGPAAVVVSAPGGRRVALRVHALLGQRDVTLQELGDVVPPLELVAGASIESDGTVLLVLDPIAVAARAANVRRRSAGGAADPAAAADVRAVAATVLIVEDALTVRELQRSILERAGYRVRAATDGMEALASLADERPDVVLTDIEMPNLDGFGLIEAIRSRPELSSLPVLIMSSRNDAEDRARGLQAGADGYIVKQAFDAATLLAAVARVLGQEPPA
ncbi:hypothetical protein DSM112329_03775 [Paraconexibacter sp. AEG42_29]|uniref:histidine kinase n=1 Tax=Paraconexibacter sp. AEG42_29 TaxID=2997339 RepID=A0AAU7AYV6_9ACTN